MKIYNQGGATANSKTAVKDLSVNTATATAINLQAIVSSLARRCVHLNISISEKCNKNNLIKLSTAKT